MYNELKFLKINRAESIEKLNSNRYLPKKHLLCCSIRYDIYFLLTINDHNKRIEKLTK